MRLPPVLCSSPFTTHKYNQRHLRCVHIPQIIFVSHVIISISIATSNTSTTTKMRSSVLFAAPFVAAAFAQSSEDATNGTVSPLTKDMI